MSFKQQYTITTLGEFSITCGSKKIYDNSNRSKKPWNLLEYMIINRDRTISPDELINLLWSDNNSYNPSGALKVLLYRLRKSLEAFYTDDIGDFIMIKKGHYYINPSISIVLDIDSFEEYSTMAADRLLPPKKRLELYNYALAFYKGDFLPRNTEAWVIPIASYYHNMFINNIYEMIQLLYDACSYSEIVNLCRKALIIEQFNDKLYYNLINALYKSGQQNEALQEYSNATDLLYKKFGITPSDDLKALYKIIITTTKSLETDITIIKETLQEKGEATGAFFCEYEFFKDIYQLESRACARSGDSIYLCLITLSSSTGEEINQKIINKAMEDLISSIHETLRKGDVFARYSVSQYVLLLPSAAFENVEVIMKRIHSTFYKKYMKKDINLQYKLHPLDPII